MRFFLKLIIYDIFVDWRGTRNVHRKPSKLTRVHRQSAMYTWISFHVALQTANPISFDRVNKWREQLRSLQKPMGKRKKTDWQSRKGSSVAVFSGHKLGPSESKVRETEWNNKKGNNCCCYRFVIINIVKVCIIFQSQSAIYRETIKDPWLWDMVSSTWVLEKFMISY